MNTKIGTLAQINPPFQFSTVGEIVTKIVEVLYGLGLMLFIIFVIWSGITWITSGGDSAKVAKARQILVAAIVGLAIMLLAFAIRSLLIKIVKQ